MTCICTSILNEQEYLEDWVRYNLNLGIDKIFIFEDFGSESHSSILEKYGDKVELFNSESFGWDKKKRQNYNLTELFSIVRKRNIYDWCFIIDIDEYITLENEDDKLEDVLNIYSGSSEVLIYWKNYGANGHIKKPDYSLVKSYREYYTKECGYSVLDMKYYFICKKAINLHKISPDYRISLHLPSMIYYVNTRSAKNFRIPTFDKIYLKHYVTKSLEEYLWKLNVRGMCCPGHRKIDDFFEMNPELIEYKEKITE